MKCVKSFKRSMLVGWGMTKLDGQMTLEEVNNTIRKMMRKTTDEVKAFVKAEREAKKEVIENETI